MVSVMFRSIWSILSCLSSSCRDAVSVCSWQYSDVFSICVQSLKYCLVSGIVCFGVGYSNTSSASRRMVIRVLVSASCRRFKISKCNEWWVQQGCRCWIEFHHGYPFQWQCVVRWIKWPWSMWFARSLAARGPLQIAVQAAWGVRPHQTIPKTEVKLVHAKWDPKNIRSYACKHCEQSFTWSEKGSPICVLCAIHDMHDVRATCSGRISAST